MPSAHGPGLHVDETAAGAPAIAMADCAVAAFLGIAPDAGAATGEAILIESWDDFARIFASRALAAARKAGPEASAAPNALATAVQGFFENGGRRCHAVNIGAGQTQLRRAHLSALDGIEEIGLIAAPGFADRASIAALDADCQANRGRFAILDAVRNPEPLERLARISGDGLRPPDFREGRGALYTPWILARDAVSGARVVQPPSGHIAGAFARNDAARGVWKAPANVALEGALGLTRDIAAAELALLTPKGVNTIRRFPHGIRVWGARTLAPEGSEHRYIPVRRLMTMIELSLARGLQWAVFEPNDANLHAAIRRTAVAFMASLWRAGALAGAKPEEAFFVECGPRTMTRADLDAGRVIVQVGAAPLRPGEFLVLRIRLGAGAADG